MNKWQPIDAAPKGGFFMVYGEGQINIAENDGNGAFECIHSGDWLGGSCLPTHWMPLPEEPQGDDHAGS